MSTSNSYEYPAFKVKPNTWYLYDYHPPTTEYWLYCGHLLTHGQQEVGYVAALPRTATDKWIMLMYTLPGKWHLMGCGAICQPAMDSMYSEIRGRKQHR